MPDLHHDDEEEEEGDGVDGVVGEDGVSWDWSHLTVPLCGWMGRWATHAAFRFTPLCTDD